MGEDEIAAIFKKWNTGVLDSYLMQITTEILEFKDDDGKAMVTKITDSASQKGTGKWTAINALDLGMPVTLIGEAVFARCLSSIKDERVRASKILGGPQIEAFTGDKQQFIDDLEQALYASKMFVPSPCFSSRSLTLLCTASLTLKYVILARLARCRLTIAQGFMLMREAAKEYDWHLNYAGIALMWRGGCIIKSCVSSFHRSTFPHDFLQCLPW